MPLILGIPTIACDGVGSATRDATVETRDEPSDFAFEVATHAPNAHRPQSLHAIIDRGPVDVMTGPQGLNMAILVPRVLDPVHEPLTLLAQLESGPTQIGEVQLELSGGERQGDALVFHDVYLIFTKTAVMPDDYARLRVVLTDADGHASELRHTVRLVP